MSTSPLDPLAKRLGVRSLERLGIERHGRLWRIPERDAEGQVTGWATRSDAGEKSFVKRGQRGLTMPWPIQPYTGTSPDDPVVVDVALWCRREGNSDSRALPVQLNAGTPTRGPPQVCSGLTEVSVVFDRAKNR